MLRVLFVCTGNICRSPLAQAFLVERSRRALGAPVVATSAGTWGRGGRVHPDTAAVARELGVSLDGHRSRPVTVDLVREADVVLGLTGEHRDDVVAMARDAAAKTFTLKELAGLLEALPPAGPPPEDPSAVRERALARIGEAHRLRRSPGAPVIADEDVFDPIGEPRHVQRAVASDISRAVDRVVAGLFGATEPRGQGDREVESGAPPRAAGA